MPPKKKVIKKAENEIDDDNKRNEGISKFLSLHNNPNTIKKRNDGAYEDFKYLIKEKEYETVNNQIFILIDQYYTRLFDNHNLPPGTSMNISNQLSQYDRLCNRYFRRTKDRINGSIQAYEELKKEYGEDLEKDTKLYIEKHIKSIIPLSPETLKKFVDENPSTISAIYRKDTEEYINERIKNFDITIDNAIKNTKTEAVKKIESVAKVPEPVKKPVVKKVIAKKEETPYYGPNDVPKDRYRATMREAVQNNQISYWGVKKADQKIIMVTKNKKIKSAQEGQLQNKIKSLETMKKSKIAKFNRLPKSQQDKIKIKYQKQINDIDIRINDLKK